MKRFVEGTDREQSTLFPECVEDWIDENNPVRVIDVFVDELDLAELGFDGVAPETTGRPGYHPSVLLKLYIYGYLNRVQSSRRLEREALRNVEVMWLTGRLAPDHKTIADFRKDNGGAIRQVCARFIELCRAMGLLTEASVAIDDIKIFANLYPLQTPLDDYSLRVRDGFLYVGNSWGGLYVLDVTDPAQPKRVNEYWTPARTDLSYQFGRYVVAHLPTDSEQVIEMCH